MMTTTMMTKMTVMMMAKMIVMMTLLTVVAGVATESPAPRAA